MDEQSEIKCEYTYSTGGLCPGQAGKSGLCFWHDTEIIKDGENIKRYLEQWLKSGKSAEGFSLRNANLENISLSKTGSEKGYNLSNCDFSRANLKGAHFYNVDFKDSSFLKADLSGANLNCSNLDGVNILAANLANAKMEHISWGKYAAQETLARKELKKGNHSKARDLFIEAEETYRNLKQLFTFRGQFGHASQFYYKEKVMRRHTMPTFSQKRIFSKLEDLICGYGSKSQRVILCSLVIILGAAFLYFSFGINDNGGKLICDSNLSLGQNLSNFANCLYFSVVTFTTLGYGDISPTGWARLIAATEAFIGGFSMALFVVVFSKKMTR